MTITREMLFFFSALGAFNGVLMSLWFLFFVRPKHLANTFLGGFLAALSLRVGKSVIFFFYPDLAMFYLQLGLSACVFVGPLLYFYFRTVLTDDQTKTWRYHLVGLLLLVVGFGIAFPFDGNLELWRPHVINVIYAIWGGYLIASGVLLYQKIFAQRHKTQRITSVEVWLISLLLGTTVVWAAYNLCYFTSYIAGALSFSFIFYVLGLTVVMNRKKDFIPFRREGKYGARSIDPADATELLAQLNSLMEEEALYLDANLNLTKVAARLKVIPHRLSQLLNEHQEQSFPNYLNTYRVAAAKNMMVNGTAYSIEGIGYDCGFNSKSTFYAAFKRHTGTTPAAYRKSLENKHQD